MTDKDVKVPNPATVDRALAKEAAGEELRANEEKALAAQAAIDTDRGFRKIEWKPNVFLYQHIATGHTTPATEGGELDMIRYANEYRMNLIRG